MGLWGYDMATLFEKVCHRPKPDPGLPRLHLGFFKDVIVFDHKRQIYYLVTRDKTRGIRRLKDWMARVGPRVPGRFRLNQFKPDISKARFENMVRQARSYIRAGDIYQANLSQRFSFGFEGDPLKLYGKLREINPSPFASFFRAGDTQIISSSPERLIRKRGRACETRPIAGTRPRRAPGKTQRQLERDLLGSRKERAEHIMLVDLERNDLGRVCDWKTVRVEELMSLEKYSHVIHIASKITGRLRQGKDAFDLIASMFPGGTITGCPKVRCMEIIDELEPVRRGIYTGSIGYVDFNGDLDLNIVIRTLVLRRQKGYLQVGAGVVHDSRPHREFQETLHKGKALRKALLLAAHERATSP